MTQLTQLLTQYDGNFAAVLDADFSPSNLYKLDLSPQNKDLEGVAIDDAAAFSDYLFELLAKEQASIAVGGYNEERLLYKRSPIFQKNNEEERFIHLGVDLWTKANTKICAPLSGKVHSFQDNTALGDYGPTIILEHQLAETIFYTLYGHLSLASLENLSIGQQIEQGSTFATLGNFPINGDYAPHLHFQLIDEIGTYRGDFPGVTSLQRRAYDLLNCPNPNLILRLALLEEKS